MNGQPAPDGPRTETIDSVVDQSCGVKINVLGASNDKIKDDVDVASQDLDCNAQQRTKKSSFQITKIVNKVDKPRVDDPDDVTNTEDASSEILEVSRNTDVEIDPVSPDTLHSTSSDDNGQVLAATTATTAPASPSTQNLLPQLSNSIKRRTNDGNSRFKIVRIESHKPHRRGRWTCQEFADPPQCTVSSSTKVQKTGSSCSNNDSGSGNSSVSNSIYYVHGEEDSSVCPFTAAIVYSDGHLVLDPNLVNNSLGNGAVVASISSPSQCSTLEPNMQFGLLQAPKSFSPIPEKQNFINQLSLEETALQHLHNRAINGLDSVDGSNIFDSNQFVSKARSDFFLSNSNHPEINLFASSNDNASMLDLLDPDNSIAGSFCALDNKIEQAMDLVKSHLRFAVGEEVGMLKEQIKELCFRKSMLEYENTILRADATPETLAKIHQPVANHSPSNTDLNSLPS